MKIRVTKINSGLMIEPVRSGKVGEKTFCAMLKAWKIYQKEALAVMQREDLHDSGYAETFVKLYPRQLFSVFPDSLCVDFEIWGFASGTFDEDAKMADTGSSASDFRARFLLALQEPLGPPPFSKVLEVDD